MTKTFKAACIQVCACRNMNKNIQTAIELTKKAKNSGADIVFMPENVAMIEDGKDNIISKAIEEDKHTALIAFKELAKETAMWLHCGTLSIKAGKDKIINRTYVLAPNGTVAAYYDKIHLFDVSLGNDENYKESEYCQHGSHAVTTDIPWGKLGLSICYDLRFPHLYRTLAKSGADFIAVPAAFTRPTGKAHWHVLLRARAIENGCYIFAPAQCGKHETGRLTYGHSLIINPWGEIIEDAGENEGFIIADINLEKVTEARNKIPALKHDRDFV